MKEMCLLKEGDIKLQYLPNKKFYENQSCTYAMVQSGRKDNNILPFRNGSTCRSQRQFYLPFTTYKCMYVLTFFPQLLIFVYPYCSHLFGFSGLKTIKH